MGVLRFCKSSARFANHMFHAGLDVSYKHLPVPSEVSCTGLYLCFQASVNRILTLENLFGRFRDGFEGKQTCSPQYTWGRGNKKTR